MMLHKCSGDILSFMANDVCVRPFVWIMFFISSEYMFSTLCLLVFIGLRHPCKHIVFSWCLQSQSQ